MDEEFEGFEGELDDDYDISTPEHAGATLRRFLLCRCSCVRPQVAEQGLPPRNVAVGAPQGGKQFIPLFPLGIELITERRNLGTHLPAAAPRAAERFFAHKKVHKSHLSAQIS